MLAGLGVLLVLCAPGPLPAASAAGPRAAAAGPDEAAELIAEFKRFYSADRSPQERLESVAVLDGIDRTEAARALLAALEDQDFVVRRRAIEVLGRQRREETARMLLDEVLLGRKQAKRTMLRAGVAEALGGMGHAFAYDALMALLSERDEQLRLAGIAALGALGDPQACAALSAIAAEGDGTLAVAALDALVAIGSAEGARAAVVAGLHHEDWRVRARAIGAVVALRLKAGVRGLIELLRDEEGRLAGDAYQALKAVTLREFGDDAKVWSDWWDRTEPRFEMPDLEKVREARERAAREGTSYSKAQKRFLGLETRSENLLFVIDVSGSMEIPFGDPDRLAAMGREYSSLKRLEIVKEELVVTIQELPDTTSFNILAFATDVSSWKQAPARANVLNKNNAITWVQRLKPLGGRAAGFRAQTGLDTAAAEEGATNTHLALLTALGEDPDGRGGTGFVTDAPKSPLDTIFFLTDGEPTVGKSVDMNVIRQEVRRVNEFRGVQIHVIYVGEFGGDDFERLARENDGLFVAIGG
jgi:HEAT repeat protein